MKKILLLSNNENSKNLYEWLVNKGYVVDYCHDKITLDMVKDFNPDLVISYNYIYLIKEDIINYLDKKIINMHTSYLPWNRGSSPNIWSFIEDSPKGVTIHKLEKGLDTGEIIVQKECFFDENVETLASTYKKLNDEIVELLKDNWDCILEGNYPVKAQSGQGSYHRVADLEALLDGRKIDYSMTISDFKKFIRA